MTTNERRRLVNRGDAVPSTPPYRGPPVETEGGRTVERQQYETIVIGGGQAGLATGYHLRQAGRSFVILDRSERIGDSWRARWDSLRLYSPAQRDGLPGMRFPARSTAYPTKDEMGDYLEAYAARFELPVRSDTSVDMLTKIRGRYIATAGDRQFEADDVV